MRISKLKYCSQCGASVSWRIPAQDDRERFICDDCGVIHYQNPRVVVGCLPVYEDRILLCRRAIEPRHGYWTLPAGFLENGETALAGARRETWEEARAQVCDEGLYTLFDLPHISQIYMFYLVSLVDGKFETGSESSDVRLFSQEEIPWDELAFPVVVDTLKHYFSDREGGHFPVRQLSIDPERRLAIR